LPSVAAGDLASGSCFVGDPNCADGADAGAAGPLPDAIAVGSGEDDGPQQISFGGFFYSDGTSSQLCSALAESFPPQCGSVVIDIEAPLETERHATSQPARSGVSRYRLATSMLYSDITLSHTMAWRSLSGTPARTSSSVFMEFGQIES